MQKVLVIDPVISNRSNLVYQLRQVGEFQFFQSPSVDEAKSHLFGFPSFTGLVFFTWAPGEELDRFVEALGKIRNLNPNACLLAITQNINLDEMRQMIQSGVDQVLIRPFNANQVQEKIQLAEAFRKKVQSESAQNSASTRFETSVEALTATITKISLIGYLSERIAWPEVRSTGNGTIILDLEHLSGINSIGIRLWLLWLRDLEQKGFQRFEFENLHPAILRQISLVQGMVPENGSVNSFYLYYWNEDQGLEREFKMIRGRDFTDEKMILAEKRTLEENGTKTIFSLDVSMRKLLRFYKGQTIFV